jgi:hypothetical protein
MKVMALTTTKANATGLTMVKLLVMATTMAMATAMATATAMAIPMAIATVTEKVMVLA